MDSTDSSSDSDGDRPMVLGAPVGAAAVASGGAMMHGGSSSSDDSSSDSDSSSGSGSSSDESDDEGPISNNIIKWPQGGSGKSGAGAGGLAGALDDSSSDEEPTAAGAAGFAMPPKKQFSEESVKIKKLKTPKAPKEPKVRTPGTGGGKPRRAPAIPKDENGNVILPFKLGGITYHSLGKINPKPGFHSDKYIWPVGFTSSRIFFSIKNPDNKIRYMSRIVDDEDGPKFEVSSEEDPEIVISGPSPTKSWATILRAVNEARKKPDARNSVSGPEYFGFAAPAVQELFQKLPNAEKCTTYYVFANGKRKIEDEDEASKRMKLDEHGNALTFENIRLKDYTIEEVVIEADALEKQLEAERQSSKASGGGGGRGTPKPKLTSEEKKAKREAVAAAPQPAPPATVPPAPVGGDSSSDDDDDDEEVNQEIEELQANIKKAKNQMGELQNRVREWGMKIESLKKVGSQKKKMIFNLTPNSKLSSSETTQRRLEHLSTELQELERQRLEVINLIAKLDGVQGGIKEVTGFKLSQPSMGKVTKKEEQRLKREAEKQRLLQLKEEKRIELERIKEEKRLELERQKEEKRLEQERLKEERRLDLERKKQEQERIREEKRIEMERIKEEKKAEHERLKNERALARAKKFEEERKRKEEEARRKLFEKYNKSDDTDLQMDNDYAPPSVVYPECKSEDGFLDSLMLYEFVHSFSGKVFDKDTGSVSWENFVDVFDDDSKDSKEKNYLFIYKLHRGLLNVLIKDKVRNSFDSTEFAKTKITACNFPEITRLYLMECPEFTEKYPEVLVRMGGSEYIFASADDKRNVLKFLCEEVMTSKTVGSVIDGGAEKLEGLEKGLRRLERERENAIFEAKSAMEKASQSQNASEQMSQATEDKSEMTSDVDSMISASKSAKEIAVENGRAAIEKIENDFFERSIGVGLEILKVFESIRCLYLGRDRYFNEYIFLPCSCMVLVIKGDIEYFEQLKSNIYDISANEEKVDIVDEMEDVITQPKASDPEEEAQESVCEMELDIESVKTKVETYRRHNFVSLKVAYFDTVQSLESLIVSLNPNGLRESLLKERLDVFKGAIFSHIHENGNGTKSLKATRNNAFGRFYSFLTLVGDVSDSLWGVFDEFLGYRGTFKMSPREVRDALANCHTLEDFRSAVYSVCQGLNRKLLKQKTSGKYSSFCQSLMSTRTLSQLVVKVEKMNSFVLQSWKTIKADSSNDGGKGEEQDDNLDVVDDLCVVCKGAGELLWCDSCPGSYHLQCLNPPLESFAEGDWFCPRCSVRKPIIFAKMKGYPWWPATVESCDISKDTIRLKFFATYAVVDTFIGKHIVAYEDYEAPENPSNEMLAQALQEARKLVKHLKYENLYEKWFNPLE
eukprot:Nk52_evm9s128 gene=Nk52_evmTU9s128